VYGELRQAVDRTHVLIGEFGQQQRPVLVPCAGQASWRVTLFSDDGAFGDGYAFASIYVYAYVDNDSAAGETFGIVQLSDGDRALLEPLQPKILSLEMAGHAKRVWSDPILGQPNVLQTSSNLRDWTSVSTNLPLTSPFPWLDTSAASPGRSQRFYRLLTTP
jgi:hypothetical protein